MMAVRVTRFAPGIGRLALIGVLYFFLIATVLQFLRPDYSFMGTPLSFYLLGPYSGWLHSAFYALAAAIALLGAGCYLSCAPAARTGGTPALFFLGATGVLVTAIFRTDTNGTPTLHGIIHILAASVAFLCVSAAMLVQSWRFRQDPRWQAHFRPAMELAVFEFIVLWWYALFHYPARGFMEKMTILLILLWLGLAAWWLQQPLADS